MRTTSPNEHSWSSSCARKRREYLRALRYLGTIFVRVTSTLTVLAMAVETTAPTKQPRGRLVVVGGAGGPQRFVGGFVAARQRTCGRSSAARRSASIVRSSACAAMAKELARGWCGRTVRGLSDAATDAAIDGEQNRTKSTTTACLGCVKSVRKGRAKAALSSALTY